MPVKTKTNTRKTNRNSSSRSKTSKKKFDPSNSIFGEHKEKLLNLFTENSIIEEDIILTSGQISAQYIDTKQALLKSDGIYHASKAVLEALKPEVNLIGGYLSNAFPVACGVSTILHEQKRHLDTFFVRGQAKTRGKSRWIDGPVDHGSTVCLVTDLLTDGSLIIDTIRKIQEEYSVQIIQVIAILDKLEGGSQRLEELGIEVSSICTINEIIEE